MDDVLNVVPDYAYLANFSQGEWVNDELLYVTVGYSSGGNTAYQIGFILDPFKGIWREDVLTELPDIDRSMPFAVAPDVSRVLYYQSVTGPVLWDLVKRQAIWTGQKAQFPGIDIQWSADSTFVALETGAEHLILDRDGRVVISLDQLNTENIINTEMYSPFRWSPDSRYLAITMPSLDKGVFSILDLESRSLVYTCPGVNSPYFWSSDSNYIVFSVNFHMEPYGVILSLENGIVAKLSFKVNGYIDVLGWSEKFLPSWPSQ